VRTKGRRRATSSYLAAASAVAVAAAMTFASLSASAAAPFKPIDPPQHGAGLPAPRLPAPFVLPELTHPKFDARVDWFLGRLSVRDADRPSAVQSSSSIAAIARASVESSIFVPRRVYVGLTYPFAVAMPPDGGLSVDENARPSGRRSMLGNVEGHVRAVFPLPTFLEIGFTLAVVAPTATFNRAHRPNRSATDAAASLDPTNQVHFLPGRVALRPAGDLRILRGPLVIQARHGIDILIDDIGIDSVKVAGRLLGHAGLLVRRDLEVSVEASQVYFIASDEKVTGAPGPDTAFAEKYRISDEHRSALTIGPGIRFSYADVDFGAQLITNFGAALSPVTDQFVALRLSIIQHIGGYH